MLSRLIYPGCDCLGFPPRSNSFAFEPAVQLRSIFSLSGVVNKNRKINTPYLPPVRKSARTQKAFSSLSHIK